MRVSTFPTGSPVSPSVDGQSVPSACLCHLNPDPKMWFLSTLTQPRQGVGPGLQQMEGPKQGPLSSSSTSHAPIFLMAGSGPLRAGKG